MKEIIRAIISLICFAATGQNVAISEIMVKYDTSSLRDHQKIESVDAKNIVQGMNLLIEGFEFELLANKDVALFQIKKQLTNNDVSPYIYNLAIIACDGHETWYVDRKNSTKFVVTDSSGEPMCLTYDQDLLWDVKGAKKTIGNFTCYKATTIRKEGKRDIEVTAWFTDELPFSFGPLGIDGLPGLILELNVGEITYKASDIKLGQNEKIKTPKYINKMTHKEYCEKLDEDIGEIKNQGG